MRPGYIDRYFMNPRQCCRTVSTAFGFPVTAFFKRFKWYQILARVPTFLILFSTVSTPLTSSSLLCFCSFRISARFLHLGNGSRSTKQVRFSVVFIEQRRLVLAAHFRNLFNDFYAQDTSKKIRAVM